MSEPYTPLGVSPLIVLDPAMQHAFARTVRTREAAEQALDLLARCADVIAACIEMPGMVVTGALHDEIRALLARVDGGFFA